MLSGSDDAEAPPADALPPVSTFASFRLRNYRLYAIGQLISVTGTWMQNIAFGWLALELSHSGTTLGIVVGIRFLPMLLVGPWGGLISDRVNVRNLLMLTQSIAAVFSTALALLAWRGALSIPLMIAFQLALGLTNAFDNPARMTFISQIVDLRHLPNAIALNSTMINIAKVVGPGLAGLVIGAFGITPCFVVNAASFVAVVISLLMMRPSEIAPVRRAARAAGQIRAGVRHVAETPRLRYPMVLVIVTGILTWEFPISLPILINGAFHSGPQTYGLAMALMSVGAVAGGLVAARRTQLTVPSLCVSCFLWGLVVTLAAIAPGMPLSLGLLILVGSGSVTFNASAKTLLQTGSDPQMRGRVMSLWSLAWQGGGVLGAPLLGLAGNTLGPRYPLLIGGVAALLAGGLVYVAVARDARADPAPIGSDSTPQPSATDSSSSLTSPDRL